MKATATVPQNFNRKTGSKFYLDEIHRHKPDKIPVSGELPEVLSNCHSFFWMGGWSVINTGSGTDREDSEIHWKMETTHSWINGSQDKTLTLWVSVPHPVLQELPFGNGVVAFETLPKSRWVKKLPVSHRRNGRSRNPPCSRRSMTEIQRPSPKRWTRNSGSSGVCDQRRTRQGQPAMRCGGGPPEWGNHHKDTGKAETVVLVWPRTPRTPRRTGQREGHLWRGPSHVSAPPLQLWSGNPTWVTEQTNVIH